MKRLAFLLLISFSFIECKKDQTDPQTQIAKIVGRWRFAGSETEVNGKKQWVLNPNTPPVYIYFRSDGVLLDTYELGWCCPPKKYRINGTLIEIQPKDTVTINPGSAAIRCYSCEEMVMNQNGVELIMGCKSGSSARMKYVRD